MDTLLLFNIASYLPGMVWLSYFFIPKHRLTNIISNIVIVILAVLYTWTALPDIPKLIPIIANPTFENIRLIFIDPKAVAIGWTHFVIADLMIGKFITRDSISVGFPFWVRIPSLLVTLFFGPVGLVFYLIVRTGLRRHSNQIGQLFEK